MTTLGEAANVTPTYEKLRAFVVSMVREKLLHGSNPTLITHARQLALSELEALLEGAFNDGTSPLWEAQNEIDRLKAEREQLNDAAADFLDATAETTLELNRRLAEAQKQVEELSAGFVETAPWVVAAQDVANMFDPLKAKVGPVSLLAVARGVKAANTDLRAAVEKYRADFIRDQAELASLRLDVAGLKADLEQAAKVTTVLTRERDAAITEQEILRTRLAEMKAGNVTLQPVVSEPRYDRNGTLIGEQCEYHGTTLPCGIVGCFFGTILTVVRAPVPPDEPIKCATFSPDTIPADVRARMDADRKAAEAEDWPRCVRCGRFDGKHHPDCKPLGLVP